MKPVRVGLTIAGVPEFRYGAARQSRLDLARALAAVPEGGDICRLVLRDRLGLRPDVEHWWSREREGHKTADQVFGRELLAERIPWLVERFKRADGTEFAACQFRHSVHFTTFQLYQPRTQSELDDAAIRREAKREAARVQAEREAAPLFAGGGA